ncbi:MAG TPA: DUF559 domain-containing protein [Acidimicrobiales bacterium]|nr:DUF559 domain-containing protein [Acidimicrobiales bacterium]
MTIDELMHQAAAEQHGLLSRAQCRMLGVSPRELTYRIQRGDWLRLSRRVLLAAGAPRTARTQVMAAVLDAVPGSVASHRTAAALWGLPGFRLGSLDVTQPRSRDGMRPPALGTLHEPRLLRPHHCTVLDGIPVTTPARTLFDLAGIEHPGKVERAVDNALTRSPALLPRLHSMLEELARRGRPGIRAMRRMLAERPAGYIAPASGLESRVIRLLAEVGIEVRRQVDVGGDDWIGRTDLLVVGTRLVVEVDSVRHHTSRLDRERDAARDAAMAAAGLTVVRVSEEDVWTAPQQVVRRVQAVLRRAA